MTDTNPTPEMNHSRRGLTLLVTASALLLFAALIRCAFVIAAEDDVNYFAAILAIAAASYTAFNAVALNRYLSKLGECRTKAEQAALRGGVLLTTKQALIAAAIILVTEVLPHSVLGHTVSLTLIVIGLNEGLRPTFKLWATMFHPYKLA
jgi:uncharacterized membrane-anchored protein